MGNPIIAAWVPPALRQLANKVLGGAMVYRGPYPDWDSARSATKGYGQDNILARVVDATNKVLRGEARYEQDGVAKKDEPPVGHVLPCLLMAAALDRSSSLSVLDFGGGLASLYLRWRRWLSPLAEVQWRVVEQPQFVEAGARLFANAPQVSFSTSIDEASKNSAVRAPNAVVASGVLHYLADPGSTLAALISLDARIIVIDRTLCSRDGVAKIMTQHVPRTIGAASYPSWLLSRESVHAQLSARYRLLAEFSGQDASIRAGRVRGDHIGSAWLRMD